MLTKWKHTSTTFEHIHSNNRVTKKKRPQDSFRSSYEDIAISFVKPLARENPHYIERVKSSKSSTKKRKKSNHHRSDGSANVEDLEPILCITSPHRVALLERSSSASGAILSESKSRNYVSRPGSGTSFDVKTGSNSFEGVVSCGAQYDPTSNLMYAIRNGGELVIWTAASSSFIQGPDQPLDNVLDGGAPETACQNTKKRKELDCSGSFDRIISQHLTFPEEKSAVTLTPFYIASSGAEKQRLLVVGASGCCEDGSVWIAICRDGKSSFELFLVDGSSMADTEFSRKTSATKSTKRKATPAKSKKASDDVAQNWKLLDSRAVGSMQSGDSKHAGSFMVDVQSVVLSKDEGSVILFHHQVKIYSEEEKEHTRLVKSTKQNVLEVSNKEDIFARLDSSGNSLCIVHKSDGGLWILSSVELSPVDYKTVNSLSSLALTRESRQNAVLFSFGCLRQNVYAILSKEKNSSSVSLLSTLRIVDVRRKVELLVENWVEGNAQHEETSSTINALSKMLHGMHCHAMITNELDGSLVLVTSPTECSGSFGIMSSTIFTPETSSGSQPTNEPIFTASSLASALRAAAAVEPSHSNHIMPENMSNIDLVDKASDSGEHRVCQKHVDAAVDLACKKLNEAAESILDFISILGEAEKKPISNGKSSKKIVANKSLPETEKWKDAFNNGMTTIQNTNEKNPITDSVLTNGLKNGTKIEPKRHKNRNIKGLPMRYIFVAFRHTISLLIAIHRRGKPLSTDGKLMLESIRQESVFVLLKVLQSDHLLARMDYDIDIPDRVNAFMHLFRVCPSVLIQNEDSSSYMVEKHRVIGALDILDAILNNVQDLPERLLVYMIKFLLRNVGVYDAVSYFSKSRPMSQSNQPSKGSRLAKQFLNLSSSSDLTDEKRNDLQSQVATKLLAEAVLDFTSKIVMYSTCNQFLLSKSLRDVLNAAEVETFLVTLSKLLKSRDSSMVNKERSRKNVATDHSSLYSGVIDWISSLTDAHMSNILTVADKGGLVVERIQADVRSALIQTKTANELKEISDRVVDNFAEHASKLSNSLKLLKSRESSIAAYSIERLAF